MVISHRVNSIQQLKDTSLNYGIEIDIRYDSSKKDLILSHNQEEENSPLLKNWIEHYNHSFLILNSKTSLSENLCIDYMLENGIKNWYFLDSQIPDIIRFNKEGFHNFICRYSIYENLNLDLLEKNSKYIWIDSFGDYDLDFCLELKDIPNIFISGDDSEKEKNDKSSNHRSLFICNSFLDNDHIKKHILKGETWIK